MTYDEFLNTQDDIYQAFLAGELSETQLDNEMEALQEEWEEDGEE